MRKIMKFYISQIDRMIKALGLLFNCYAARIKSSASQGKREVLYWKSCL